MIWNGMPFVSKNGICDDDEFALNNWIVIFARRFVMFIANSKHSRPLLCQCSNVVLFLFFERAFHWKMLLAFGNVRQCVCLNDAAECIV